MTTLTRITAPVKKKRETRPKLLPDGNIEIPLTWGMVAITEGKYFGRVKGYIFWAVQRPRDKTWYAYGYKEGDRHNRVYLHNLIAGYSNVDHINGQGLDCRMSNLRPATDSQQKMNRSRRADNTSGTTGVHWDTNKQKWEAYISVNGRKTRLGYYTDEDKAIEIRRNAELRIFGEYSALHRDDE